MNAISFSLRIWAVAQLLFNGLGLLLSALSILPLMLVPALAGGLCSWLFFFGSLAGIVRFTSKRHVAFLLLSIAVLISCFIPLYLFTYVQMGRLVWWDAHSRIYPAILMAAGCGILSIALHHRSLFRMQRQGFLAFQS